MKMQELVSVIIPTYNRTSTLERAIKSVKNQTYKNIEILVVDDNANNQEARKKVEEIVNKFQGIKLIQNKQNLGGGLARNEGIKNARGEFIAFLDDDDEFYPEKIEKQYNLYKSLNNDKVGMIYCYAKYIKGNDGKIRKVDYEGNPLKQHLILCIAATSWWFCPKHVLEDVKGFENVSSHQDAITLFKILKAGYEIYRVPEVLLNYYVHSGTGITKVSKEWMDVDNKYMKMYQEIKDRFSDKEKKQIEYSFYKRATSYYYRLNEKKLLKENTKKMFSLYPLKLDTIKAGLKNVLINFKRG